jgi:colanic acid/amylovoran biosynthesis glycosyltransferase
MPGQLIRILHCASLREKKGHEFALRAFAKVKQQFPNIEFTIIGDGPLLGKLKILTEHLGVADSVKFLGVKSHDDAIKEFLRAQILLYPSVTAVDGDTEGGAPVTIIEALATGMPVVSSFHADIPEVIKDGVTGLLAPERDVEQLAQHLRFLLSNPLCWTSMGDAARAHVEKSYNLRLQLERLGEIYSILDRHGQSLH